MSSSGAECADVSASARGGLAGFGAAMLGALWAYDGWNNLTLVGGEVKRPSRNIPLALISGMFVICSLYVFVNLAYFYVLPPLQVANLAPSVSVATEVAVRILGPAAAGAMAAALLASTFGTLHTSILTGARIPYAMAEEGQLPAALGKLSERSRVPILALALQGSWAAILAISGTYDTITDYVIFGSWIFYGLTAGSVFIFRRRETEAAATFRTWGYPVVPILFLVTTAWLLVNTLVTAPFQSFAGLLLVALGLPVYALLNRYTGR
jgi:APA family basic amino acid/polyamine antiporter